MICFTLFKFTLEKDQSKTREPIKNLQYMFYCLLHTCIPQLCEGKGAPHRLICLFEDVFNTKHSLSLNIINVVQPIPFQKYAKWNSAPVLTPCWQRGGFGGDVVCNLSTCNFFYEFFRFNSFYVWRTCFHGFCLKKSYRYMYILSERYLRWRIYWKLLWSGFSNFQVFL